MQLPVATYVYADDPISQAGVVSQLRGRPEIRVVDAAHLDEAAVAVVVADVLNEEVVRVLRALATRLRSAHRAGRQGGGRQHAGHRG